MSFKIFSVKITVSFLFMATLCLMLLSDKTGYALLMILAVIIHEAGHFFAMLICKCLPTEIRLIPGSVQICAPTTRLKHETFILICGPMANFLVFACLFVSCRLSDNIELLEFSLINLIYFAFNILPLGGLDGGSILFNIILRTKGYKTAEKVLNFLTVFTAVTVFLIFTVYAIKGSINYSLCILCCYLILSVFLKF